MYNYDRGGNITSKVRYAYTTGSLGAVLESVPYVYGDSNWKDKLTAYKGRSFTYDTIGNPLSDGTWTYEWQAGRRLKSMSAEGTVLTFKYDHNGLRTQKIVEQDWYPTTYSYLYNNEMLTHLTVSYTDFDETEQEDRLHFYYDSQIRPAKVSYNGVIYTYVHNLQGDVVGLLDNSGNLVVEYKYDAWGKLLSTTGTLSDTLGKRNPFRYRDYTYDEESGLYCLQKRFYSPALARFISADEPSILEEDYEDLLHNNLYSYCENNPVANFDPTGEAAINVVFSVIFGVVGFALGDFFAKQAGYSRGWKYWAIRSAVAIGGAIFGWFSAKLVTKILTLYVKKNPAVVMKLAAKYGGKTVVKTLSALGLNPVNFMDKGRLMGFIQQVFNRNPKLIMPDSWVKALCEVANQYKWSIRLDHPHNNNWNVWHINIGKYHVAISEAIRKYLQRRGY